MILVAAAAAAASRLIPFLMIHARLNGSLQER
jgi:hypothetical protein